MRTGHFQKQVCSHSNRSSIEIFPVWSTVWYVKMFLWCIFLLYIIYKTILANQSETINIISLLISHLTLVLLCPELVQQLYRLINPFSFGFLIFSLTRKDEITWENLTFKMHTSSLPHTYIPKSYKRSVEFGKYLERLKAVSISLPHVVWANEQPWTLHTELQGLGRRQCICRSLHD